MSVTCWFKKKRSLATGIAVAGSGLGTFIFSPLTYYLVQEFGWRGAILLIAAMVLQCTTFGALFRPVEEPNKSSSKKNGQSLQMMPRETNGSVPMQRPLSVGYLPPVPLQGSHAASKLTVSLGCLNRAQAEPQGKFHSHQTLRRSGGIMSRSDVLYCGSFNHLPHERFVICFLSVI